MGAVLRLPPHVRPRHVSAAAAALAGAGLVALIDPGRYNLFPPCPLRFATGWDCPLCGATRASHALARADVLTALDHNALYVLALPAVAVLVLLWLVRGRVPAWLASARVRWSMVVVAALFGIARNLPIEALSLLGSAAERQ